MGRGRYPENDERRAEAEKKNHFQKKRTVRKRESVHAAKKVRLFVVLFVLQEEKKRKRKEKKFYKKSGRENVFKNIIPKKDESRVQFNNLIQSTSSLHPKMLSKTNRQRR